MRPLSALDAISPAWTHTRDLLWRPRRWGLLLKIGLVAVLAQMGGFNLSGNRVGGPLGHGHHAGMPPALIAAIVASVVALLIVAVVVWAVLLYVGSRMQFVLFEVVLRRDTTVGPIWGRYGPATWRWIGLKLLFFLVVLVAMAPILGPMVVHLVHTAPHLDTQHPRELVSFFAGMFGFGVTIFLLGLFLSALYRLLVSFGLPSMALESTPLRETVRRVLGLAQAEPGEVFVYLLMYLVLGFAGGMVCSFAILFLMLLLCLPLGGVAAVLWFALHAGGAGAHVAMITGWVLLGLLLLTVVVLAAVMILGYLYTFLQAYALYFLGGRYPRVGAYLAPLLPPPPPAYAPAPGTRSRPSPDVPPDAMPREAFAGPFAACHCCLRLLFAIAVCSRCLD